MNQNHSHIVWRDVGVELLRSANEIIQFRERLDSGKASASHDEREQLPPCGRFGLQVGVLQVVNHLGMKRGCVSEASDRQGMFGYAGQSEIVRRRSWRQYQLIEGK